MKILALTLFASLALAAPNGLSARQSGKSPKGKGGASKGGGGSGASNEFTQGGCKSAILIYSRGTGEPKNMGGIGRGVARELKALVPDVAIEGVNYAAAVQGNLTPQGADAAGIKMASDLFKSAAAKCPQSALLGGGYSQGAALMHRTIEALPKNVQDRIAGVVLYGDTKNKQDGGRIKNFPKEKVKIFCNQNDGVCGGALMVNAGHMAYSDQIKPGAEFLAAKAKELLGSSGAAGAAPERKFFR